MNIENSSRLLFPFINYWTRKVLLTEIAVFICLQVCVLPPPHKSWTRHRIIQSERNFIPSECCNMFHNHFYKSLLKESCLNLFLFFFGTLKAEAWETKYFTITWQYSRWSTAWCQSDFHRQVLKVFDSCMASSQLNLYLHHFNKLLVIHTCYS